MQNDRRVRVVALAQFSTSSFPASLRLLFLFLFLHLRLPPSLISQSLQKTASLPQPHSISISFSISPLHTSPKPYTNIPATVISKTPDLKTAAHRKTDGSKRAQRHDFQSRAPEPPPCRLPRGQATPLRSFEIRCRGSYSAKAEAQAEHNPFVSRRLVWLDSPVDRRSCRRRRRRGRGRGRRSCRIGCGW